MTLINDRENEGIMGDFFHSDSAIRRRSLCFMWSHDVATLSWAAWCGAKIYHFDIATGELIWLTDFMWTCERVNIHGISPWIASFHVESEFLANSLWFCSFPHYQRGFSHWSSLFSMVIPSISSPWNRPCKIEVRPGGKGKDSRDPNTARPPRGSDLMGYGYMRWERPWKDHARYWAHSQFDLVFFFEMGDMGEDWSPVEGDELNGVDMSLPVTDGLCRSFSMGIRLEVPEIPQ